MSGRCGQSSKVRNNSKFPSELLTNQFKARATDNPASLAERSKAAAVADDNRREMTRVSIISLLTPPGRFSYSLLVWSRPAYFLPEPLRPLAQAFPELRRRLLTADRRPDAFKLFFQCQSATRHNFLFLLFSRGLGRNSVGGVIA